MTMVSFDEKSLDMKIAQSPADDSP
ncbi:hypothetical protein EMIT0357P_50183 [Pseudomonas marginalis]